MPTWEPRQYLRFAQERTQPCVDLLNRVSLDSVENAIDLGCGPGNSTEILARRFPRASILGLDNSSEMIQRARRDYPNFSFDIADARTWTSSKPIDLLLSNAVFHWVEKHEELFPRLMNQLRPGGALAVQMPHNFDSPVHRLFRQLAGENPWNRLIVGRDTSACEQAAFYYDVLSPHSQRVDLWETEYMHVLPSSDAIVEWYKGTGLRPYLDPLPPPQQEDFLAECRKRIAPMFPPQKDENVLFPFRRIFIVAIRR
jgi:trans-aconitate 2-methyltransferase